MIAHRAESRPTRARKPLDELRCTKCRAWAKPDTFRIEGFPVRGWKCSCGESYLHPVDANRVLAFHRLKREVLRTKLSYSGNSMIVRLPSTLAKALGLARGGPLELTLESPDRISIRILPGG